MRTMLKAPEGLTALSCLAAVLATAALPAAVRAQASSHSSSHRGSHPALHALAGASALLPSQPGRPIEIELRSAVRAVAPGDTVPVAIRLRPDAGWRTYWRYAADIGGAPVVHWRLPAGYTAAPLRWPAPVRYDAPPLTAYVYKGEVHLLGAVAVPTTAEVGSTATLGVDLAWVVSNVECIPGEAAVALSVPVGPRTIRDEAVARAFAAETPRIPVRRADWAFRAAVDSQRVRLQVNTRDAAAIAPALTAADRHASRVQFFIDSAAVIDHAAQPRIRRLASGLELELSRSAYGTRTPARITGVLAIDTTTAGRGDAPRLFLEVDAPVVPAAQLGAVALVPWGRGGWIGLATAGLLALLLLHPSLRNFTMSLFTQLPLKRVLLGARSTALVAAAAVALAGAAAAITAPEVGKAAPAFTAVDTKGATHSLAAYKGKWVVLEWFNHDCPYVKKHHAPLDGGVGNTQAMQRDYTKRGVVWLSIVSSAPGKQGFTTAERANELTKEKGAAPTAVIRDTTGALGRLYGARNTPQYAIIDPQGVLRYSGAIDDRPSPSVSDIAEATNYVRAALDAGLAGKPIAAALTQPYGCNVKY